MKYQCHKELHECGLTSTHNDFELKGSCGIRCLLPTVMVIRNVRPAPIQIPEIIPGHTTKILSPAPIRVGSKSSKDNQDALWLQIYSPHCYILSCQTNHIHIVIILNKRKYGMVTLCSVFIYVFMCVRYQGKYGTYSTQRHRYMQYCTMLANAS